MCFVIINNLGRCLEFCESIEGILGNSGAWWSLCTSTCSRNLKGSLWELGDVAISDWWSLLGVVGISKVVLSL